MHLPSTSAVFLFRLALAPLLAGVFSSAQAAPAVGEVTLTIGRALVVSSTGESTPARPGSQIQPGDRVETSDGGHVHIRFIDGALVSVRPTSRLVIEDYQYNPALPAQSTVRFRLDQGVTRAISGEAAHAARDRFRLNTPLVAIGVRGTDFVVRTQAGQTVAAVNQGSIVMAPFGEGCVAATLGPCSSAASRYLSADMGQVFAEFRSQFAQLDIKPLQKLKPSDPQAVVLASARLEAEPAVSVPREGVKQDSAATAVTSAVVQVALRKAASDELSASSAITLPVVVPPPVMVVPPKVEVATGPAQLVWGRWAPDAGSANDFSVTRALARSDGRQVTVGNDSYILYRIEPATGASIAAPVGPAFNFALQQSYAQLITPALTTPINVTGGALSIDFAAGKFATSLNLNSASTGAMQVSGAGSVRNDGIFGSATTGQSISGAVAVDAKSAGYAFDKFTNGGLLTGITVWGR